MFPWVGAPRGEHPKALRFAVLEPLAGSSAPSSMYLTAPVTQWEKNCEEKGGWLVGPSCPLVASRLRNPFTHAEKNEEKGKAI